MSDSLAPSPGHAPAAQQPDSLRTAPETPTAREANLLRRALQVLGPGVITGASNNDPSAIATFAKAGAAYGFAALWVVLLALPLMSTAVFLSAKIGMVSGRGLAGVLRTYYPRWLAYLVAGAFALTNTINAGVDIGAIASGFNLVLPWIPPSWLIVPVAFLILGLQIWSSYEVLSRIFKWLTLALFTYVATAFFTRPDWWDVFRHTVMPQLRLQNGFVAMLVALVGATLSPYLYFWQTSQRVEDEVSMGRRRLWQRRGASDGELHYAALDVNTGMLFSCIVAYFIMLVTAATLHQTGQTEVGTAADAAQALLPLAGKAAGTLFALGFIGAGLLAVPVLTTAVGYAVGDACGWEVGLDRKPREAPQFYTIIAASTLAGTTINFLGFASLQALFWSAVLNGLITPILLVLIMLASNNPAIMGRRVNGWGINVLGWLTTAAAFAAALGFLATWKQGS